MGLPMNRFDRLLARLLKKADPDLPEEKIGKVLADALRERCNAMIIDHEALRAGFEVRLRDPWGPALDALYAHQVVAVESAEAYMKETHAPGRGRG